jgi:hypothetical protein
VIAESYEGPPRDDGTGGSLDVDLVGLAALSESSLISV